VTRATRGWLALSVLLLLLAGAGAGIAQSKPARVRFWAWRAGSSDRDVRRKARLRLLEIGRPAIDPLLAEVFLGEIRDRALRGIEVHGGMETIVADTITRARRSDANELGDTLFVEDHSETGERISAFMNPDPVALAFERLPGKQRAVLLLGGTSPLCPDLFTVEVSCPLDEATEAKLTAPFRLRPR
jgi:hypothetical protein